MTEDPGYARTTSKDFEATIKAVEEAASAHGFRVLHIHNVQETLKEKGFDISKYSIVEVCNARFAHQVLSTDKRVGMMLPCRIAVYEDKDENTVLLMRPGIIGDMMPEVDLGTIPQEVEDILVSVVDEAVK